MGLISSGISKDGSVVSDPSGFFVKWISSHDDKLCHVYINGKLSGATNDASECSIVLHINSSISMPCRIEIFAVEPADVFTDFSDQLPEVMLGRRATVSFSRKASFPLGARVDFYSDSGTGQIDYQSRINTGLINLWPVWQDKCGFGLSKFGRSDFGYDGAAAVGFGRGCFGYGEFGFDADQIDWQSGELVSGKYKFAVKITDEFGNSDNGSVESEQVAIINPAESAKELAVREYDMQSRLFIFDVN
jgi:hypothetical protein